MQGVQQDRSVADSGILKTQENMGVHRGKTQRGRTVKQEQAVIQSSSPMVVSKTSHRTIPKCKVATNSAPMSFMEAENTSQSKCNTKAIWKFMDEVNTAFTELCDLRMQNMNNQWDAVLWCVHVVRVCQNLRNKVRGHEKQPIPTDFHNVMVEKLAPIYNEALKNALEQLQRDPVDAKYGKEYAKNLDKIARYIPVILKDFPDFNSHKKTLQELLRQYISNELSYLKHLKYSASSSSCRFAAIVSSNIDWILDNQSFATYLIGMNKDEKDRIKENKDKLLHEINLNIGKGVAGREEETLDVLEIDVPHKATNEWVKREYCDKLSEKLVEMEEENKEASICVQRRVCILSTLVEICDRYTQLGAKNNEFCWNLKRFVSAVIRKIILITKNNADYTFYLNESLILIDRLDKDKWLSQETLKLYLGCTQQKGLMSTDVKTGGITDLEASNWIDDIFGLTKKHTQDDALKAADLLVQLRTKHNDDIANLDTGALLRTRIEKARTVIQMQLFSSIFADYNRHKDTKNSEEQVSDAMSCHKVSIIQSKPYMSVLRDDRTRMAWKYVAYSAWHNDIKRIHRAEKLTEHDINILLDMEDLIPNTPGDHPILADMKDALKHCFRFALRDQTIPIAKMEKLSKWVDSLILHYPEKTQNELKDLQACNDAWKQKYMRAVSEDSMVSSGVLTNIAETMPAVTHPSIVKASIDASEDHFGMEQQLTPDPMQPPTNNGDMPVPATQWMANSWQPEPGYYCNPMAQEPNAIRPNSISQQPFSAPHGMPVPATQWTAATSWQPEPGYYCNPMAQEPNAIRPNSLSQQPFSAPHGIPVPATQWTAAASWQPEPGYYCNPMAQAPNAIRPNSVSQQPFSAPHGMPVPATQWTAAASWQPEPGYCYYCNPMAQAPNAIRPNSVSQQPFSAPHGMPVPATQWTAAASWQPEPGYYCNPMAPPLAENRGQAIPTQQVLFQPTTS